VQDFAKWSGLTVADCKTGLESVQSQFDQEDFDGQTYWFASADEPENEQQTTAYLLSVYDEFISGYRDHRGVCEAGIQARLSAMGNGLNNVIVINGQIIGSWRRIIKAQRMLVEIIPLRQLDEAEGEVLLPAARRYAEFFQISAENVQISIQSMD
jgi:hypothetical protein